jgi:hypothetical protein
MENGHMIESQIGATLKKTVDNQEIAISAYGLWERAGRPQGRDLQFWLQAEEQLLAARQPENGPREPQKSAPVKPEAAVKARSASPVVESPYVNRSIPAPFKNQRVSSR